MYPRIKDLRTDHDLTQKKVAQLLGLHLTQYQVYERGEVKIPIEFFIDLARLYNISIDSLVGLTNTATTPTGEPFTINNITKNIKIINNGQMTNHFN